jgi:hypothetical protein
VYDVDMDMSTAKTLLDPLHKGLVQAHQNVATKWRKLNDGFPEWTLPFDAGERAQQLHPHVKLEVATLAEEWAPNISATTALGFFALSVGDDVLLRFKHLGLDGPHNYPTQQQKNLARQLYDDDMLVALGISQPPTLLTCGYRLDADGMTLAQVVIRWDMKFNPSWEYPIYGETASSVEPLRLADMPEVAPTRLRSKKTAAQKTEEEGGSK